MSTPEIQNNVIENRVETTMETGEKLSEVNESVSRSDALKRLVELEGKTPKELLDRMKEVAIAKREAQKKGEPFMVTYTNEVRAEAVELGLDPSEYTANRTRLDFSLESLA
jgi:hypothetical protein